MRIPCPHCGDRDLREFGYLGDATAARPREDAPVEAFAQSVYVRDNPAGSHAELWYHASGCRAWLVVSRDTRTHAIHGAEPARSVAAARGRATRGSAA